MSCNSVCQQWSWAKGGAVRTRQVRAVTAAAAAVVLLSGCGQVLAGQAARDPGVDPHAAIPALLDPGNYPTTPASALGAAGTAGAFAEGRRLAENTVLPFQVDPALSSPGQLGTGIIKDPKSISMGFPDPVPAGADNHHFVTGFIATADTGGSPPAAKTLQNMVLRFATPDDAAAAAADMAARSTIIQGSFGGDPIPTAPIPVPRYPGTAAVVFGDPHDGFTVLAYTAHGPYVLAQAAGAADTAEAAAALAAATLDQQQPRIDAFTPTPLDALAALPLDPDGLLARVLPRPDGKRNVDDGLYGRNGALASQSDPARSAKLFADNGVDTMATQKANVYATRDAAAAQAVAADFAAEQTASPTMVKSDPVAGLPEAQCYAPPKSSTGTPMGLPIVYCIAPVDRYVIEVQATQERDAHQMISAQYLMLTAT